MPFAPNHPFEQTPGVTSQFDKLRRGFRDLGLKLIAVSRRFLDAITDAAETDKAFRENEERNKHLSGAKSDALVTFAFFLIAVPSAYLIDYFVLGPVLEQLGRHSFGNSKLIITAVCFLVPGVVVSTETAISLMRTLTKLSQEENQHLDLDRRQWFSFGVSGWTIAGVVLGLAAPAGAVAGMLAMFPASSSRMLFAVRVNAVVLAVIAACCHLLILWSGVRSHQSKSWLLYQVQRFWLGYKSRTAQRRNEASRVELLSLANKYAELQEAAREEFSDRQLPELLFDEQTRDVVNKLVGKDLLVPPSRPDDDGPDNNPDTDEGFASTIHETNSKARPKGGTRPRPNGSATNMLLAVVVALAATTASVAAPPDRQDVEEIASYMAAQRDKGKNPFLSETEGKDCKTISRLYARALKRSGTPSAAIERTMPDCGVLAASLKLFTGREPYWSACVMESFEPLAVDACLAGLTGAGKIKPELVSHPEKRWGAFERGVRMAQGDGKLPPSWRIPDYRSLRASRETEACGGYDARPEHMKRCLGDEGEGRSCKTIRAAYEGRLQLAYGGMLPLRYRAFECDEIRAALEPPEPPPAPSPSPPIAPAPGTPAITALPPEPLPAHRNAVPTAMSRTDSQAFMGLERTLGNKIDPSTLSPMLMPGLAAGAGLTCLAGVIAWRLRRRTATPEKWR